MKISVIYALGCYVWNFSGNHSLRKQTEAWREREGYPPQPLPHLQPDPQPQFPPQHDIFLRQRESRSELKRFGATEGNNKYDEPKKNEFQERPITSIYSAVEERECRISTVHVLRSYLVVIRLYSSKTLYSLSPIRTLRFHLPSFLSYAQLHTVGLFLVCS